MNCSIETGSANIPLPSDQHHISDMAKSDSNEAKVYEGDDDDDKLHLPIKKDVR